jgi:hypothetical protein
MPLAARDRLFQISPAGDGAAFADRRGAGLTV